MTITPERQELIEKARVAYVEAWEREDKYLTENNHPKTGHQRSSAGIIAALAVFEAEQKPTEDERAFANALRSDAEYQRFRMNGTETDASRRLDHAADLIDGFHHPVSPDDTEGEFAPGECTGAGDCDAPIHVHGCYRPHRADQCDAPGEYGHIEPQAEPAASSVQGENR